MDIIDFVKFLIGKNLSYATYSTYIAALNKFYSMNDVLLINWKKIRSYMGDHEKVAEDRPYTHSRLQLANTSLRNRGIILLMSSGGLRLGAIPLLRMRDLEPIDDYNIYKIQVYARSKKSRYISYCTPECRITIDEYIAIP